MNLLPSERSRRNIILSLTQQLKACISFSRHCEGTFGIFLVWGVMSCWISPLWGSRFNTFLAAPVSMILICFHRQAAQTHTILFGIPVKLLCESFSVSLWTYQRSIKGGRRLFGVPHVLAIDTSEPQADYHIFTLSYLSGASHWRLSHSSVAAEKTKRKRVEATSQPQITLLIQQRQIRAGVCLSLHRAETREQD